MQFPRKRRITFAIIAGSASIALAILLWNWMPTADAKPVDTSHAHFEPWKQIADRYETLHGQHLDATYDDVQSHIARQAEYVDKLSFDPEKARFFDLVKYRLKLTNEEVSKFKKDGFVAIDQGRPQSFPAAYQQVYTSDLPVFITTDSILHALHRSYDALLMELETTHFRNSIDEILADNHARLREIAPDMPSELAENVRDVDLYLSVARRLLYVPQLTRDEIIQRIRHGQSDLRTPESNTPENTPRYSVLGQEDEVNAIISDIESLRLQTEGDSTSIYGSKRWIDYSQFRPRGHYTKTPELSAYFRCMMWLGRADCGWTVLPNNSEPGFDPHSERQLRNAVLLNDLLEHTGGMSRLWQLDNVLELLVGRSDNLSAWQLLQVSRDAGFDSAISLRDENSVRLLQNAITKGNHGQQLIRSQVVRSSATVPAIYQLFGQRFVIDSYVLSKVVHDEIVFDGFLVKRMMPTGLDVMAALGNAEAVPLLKDELETWHYGANLIACNELVDELDAKFWAQSVSNIWLDSLRSLDDDLTQQTHAPEVMKTQLWQTKQLQTQLASWAELRHDNILYAKQSYGVPGCAFPDGYVEPYPAFYRKLRLFATTAQQLLKNMQLKARDKEREEHLIHVNEQQIAFFAEMAQTMNLLEQIATKELQGDPLSTVEISFLKGAFDDQGQVKFGSSSKPDYNGWYCRLYYERAQSPSRWAALDLKPTIADVHTDPHNRKVLEVGVGSAHLAVIAVDQGETSTAYVGPIYSYYEFAQPVSQRLTDEEWTKMLTSGEAPARPAWAKPLLVSATHRSQSKPNATLRRFDGEPKGALQSNGGSRSVGISDSLLKRIGQYKHVPSLDLSNAPITDEGLAYLSNLVDLRSMNLSNTKITDAALQHLSRHQHLQFLDLSSTKISDAELTHLERCVHLSILDLRKTQVTSEGVKRLKASLPHTEILR